jgi:hypothetical protein
MAINIGSLNNALNSMTTPAQQVKLPPQPNGAQAHNPNVTAADLMRMLNHINDSIVALAKAVERIDRRAHTSELQQNMSKELKELKGR